MTRIFCLGIGAVMAVGPLVGCNRTGYVGKYIPDIRLPVGFHAVSTIDISKSSTAVISIDATGQIWIGGQTVDVPGFRGALDSMFPISSRETYDVCIRAAGSTRLRQIDWILQNVVPSHLNPSRIFFGVKTAMGEERVYAYGLPILDGYRRFPWYKIIKAAPSGKERELVDQIKITNDLPGFAQVTILVQGSHYRALGEDR